MRILIVEDSEILRESVALGLRKTGHVVDAAADGAEGLWHAEAEHHDLIILDLGLPELDGMDLLTLLRNASNDVPVLILTARDGVDDRVAGLRAGADDYLVKPFAFDELVARVEALSRRSKGAASNLLEIDGLQLDLSARTAAIEGTQLPLARREYALLELLALNAGQIVTRTQIEACIYDERVEPNSNVVDAAMSILRKSIDAPGEPSRIETRRGEGYRMRPQ